LTAAKVEFHIPFDEFERLSRAAKDGYLCLNHALQLAVGLPRTGLRSMTLQV
jgi:hypothetical protein